MENEEAITIGSIVSVGRYEILYATAPYNDESNGEVDDIQTRKGEIHKCHKLFNA